MSMLVYSNSGSSNWPHIAISKLFGVIVFKVCGITSVRPTDTGEPAEKYIKLIIFLCIYNPWLIPYSNHFFIIVAITMEEIDALGVCLGLKSSNRGCFYGPLESLRLSTTWINNCSLDSQLHAYMHACIHTEHTYIQCTYIQCTYIQCTCIQCTYIHTCLIVLILMHWQQGSDNESKGDKLSSSAGCRIRTQGLWIRIFGSLNARWQTDWAIEDQANMHAYLLYRLYRLRHLSAHSDPPDP